MARRPNRRLRQALACLRSGTAGALRPSPAPTAAGGKADGLELKLLSNQQVKHFVVHGWVPLKPDEFDPDFHRGISAKCEAMEAQGLGNNMCAPEALCPASVKCPAGAALRQVPSAPSARRQAQCPARSD